LIELLHLLRFLDVELDVHNRSGFWSVCHDDTFGPVEAAGVFNDIPEGSRKVREPLEMHGVARHSELAIRSRCGLGRLPTAGIEPYSGSVAFADLSHPLDLALNDLGLAHAPARLEAPRP